MAKVTIIQRTHRTNSRGESSLFVRLTAQDKSCFFSCGVVVRKENFNARDGQVKKMCQSTNCSTLFLLRKNWIDEIIIRLRLGDKEVTVDAVRKEFQKKYKPIEVVAQPEPAKYLLPYYDEFCSIKKI